jgi:hypothetical protein
LAEQPFPSPGIGAEMTDPFMPWVLNEGEPHAYIIVAVVGR